MKKLFSIIFVSVFTISLTSAAFAANPCKPIAKACEKAGYYQGGNTVGKGLIVNCVLPITSKKMSLPNTDFSDETLNECHTLIMKKMQ